MTSRPSALCAVLTLWLAAAPFMSAAAPGLVAVPSLDPQVRSTIIPGSPAALPGPPRQSTPAKGDVTLNFPNVDVQAVAKAVLGDILGLPFSVDPSIHGVVTVQTTRPVRRADVLPLFEEALRAASLALENRRGVYAVVPLSSAQGGASVIGPADTGFGEETLVLRYANAEELKKLLDPIVPNAIAQADTQHNALIVAGTTTQRRSIRELVKQFDVDWLKGMSFALFIPQRTDSRLIAPELDKLLNGPGAQSAGMVRLITMEHLNGILAISAQPQYLEDVRRWIEVLDREGEGAERRLFVYHVQNGRAADLAKVLDGAFGIAAPKSDSNATDNNIDVEHNSSPLTQAQPNQTIIQLGGQAPRGTLPAAGSNAAGNANANNGVGQNGVNEETGATQNGTTITADETNNAILVYATPRNYALIEDALHRLDILPLQVQVDAVISEVTLNNNLQYGVQWYLQYGSASSTLAQNPTNVPTTITNPVDGSTTIIPGSPFPSQIIPGFSAVFQHQGNVYATLNALRAVTDVHVLSAPKIMVLNNHTATIQVGEQVPISTGSAISTATSNAPVVNSIDYRDTGVILKVTPRVNDSGLVLLDIAQEVSDVANGSSPSSIASPTFEQRKISTSVAVQDGETVALGGLIKNGITKTRNAIPLLGDIPIIGHLFGSTGNLVERTELIVLLTPRVIRGQSDADAIVAELKSKMEMALPPPPPPPPKPPPKPRHAT